MRLISSFILLTLFSLTAISALNVREFFEDKIILSGTGSLTLPSGTTAQRPTATDAMVRFNSDLNRFEGYKSSAWDELGGGGQGGINYLADTKDSDFEISIGNWVAFDDGAVTEPVDGTGGSPTVITCTRNTTTPIRGSGDMVVTSTAASAQGEGCSADFDIDNGMQGQKLTGSFWLDTSAANYADDDIGIFVYDKTNTNLIRVNGEDIKGTKGKIYFQFQAASDSTAYRVILMARTTAVLGYSIYFDQIAVGPTSLARGTIVTDWKAYTPTFVGFGTVTSPSIFSRRVGDTVEIQGIFTVGTPTATTASMTLGYGGSNGNVSTDSTKLTAVSIVGGGSVGATPSTTYFNGLTVLSTAGTTVNFGYQSSTASSMTAANGSTITGAGAVISFKIALPIAGWSSNAVMSEDLGGRDIVVEGVSNGAGSVTSSQDVDWTETRDTTTSWNGTQFTAPETGDYSIEGGIQISTATTVYFIANVGGSSRKLISPNVNSALHAISGSVFLNKGEVLSVRPSATVTLVAATIAHTIHIQKLASPQTTFSSETDVVVHAAGNDSDVITANTEDIPFKTTTRDTNSAWSNAGNTGNNTADAFTVPESGTYLMSGSLYFPSTPKVVNVLLAVGGTNTKYIGGNRVATQANLEFFVVDTFTKGQVITIRSDQAITLDPTTSLSYIDIVKL